MMDTEVILGRDGWLFLREGANKSLSYLNGKVPVNPIVATQWIKLIRQRSRLFPQSLHLICPEKLAVFSEFLPDLKMDEGRLGAIVAREPTVIYPIDLLKRSTHEGLFTYTKVDTHFNDFGAFLVAEEIARHFGSKAIFEPHWSTVSIRGDLGVKISESIRDDKLTLKNLPEIQIHDNGLSNRGRMIYCRNDNAHLGRLVIFGDSFSGINLARVMAIFFSEVLFVHSLAVDYGIILKFKPDFLVCELAERFLREKPADGLRIESLIIEKVIAGQGDAVRAWREQTHNPTTKFIEWDLLDYALAALRALSG